MTTVSASSPGSYCCGQCGDDREFISKNFKDPEYCYILSPKHAAKVWEDEREDCHSGNISGCLKNGLYLRAIYIGSYCTFAPFAIVLSCVAAAAACFASLASCFCCTCAACEFVASGPLDPSCEKSMEVSCLFATLAGICCAVSAILPPTCCTSTLLLPVNSTCPETLSLCGIHRLNLWATDTVDEQEKNIKTFVEKLTEDNSPHAVHVSSH